MLSDYAIVGLFLLIAIAFPIAPIVIAWVIRPKRPSPVKKATYECGLQTIGETWIQFKVQYYIFALIFLIFDIEIVFLYPWAVAYDQLGLFALVEMFIFIAILVAGLLYAWRKGVLKWV